MDAQNLVIQAVIHELPVGDVGTQVEFTRKER
jgi:hypothetical protein